MGRLAKNRQITTGSYAIRMPTGSSTVGPQRPQDGQVRFNEVSMTLEIFYSSTWHSVSQAGRVNILKDVFNGDGTTHAFTMSNAPSTPYEYQTGQEADLLVFIGNIFQEPGVAYTVSGSLIDFTSIPDPNVRIVVLHNFNSTFVR